MIDYGYVIVWIAGGKFDPLATVAVADPEDDEDGYFVEVRSVAEAKKELADHLDMLGVTE